MNDNPTYACPGCGVPIEMKGEKGSHKCLACASKEKRDADGSDWDISDGVHFKQVLDDDNGDDSLYCDVTVWQDDNNNIQFDSMIDVNPCSGVLYNSTIAAAKVKALDTAIAKLERMTELLRKVRQSEDAQTAD